MRLLFDAVGCGVGVAVQAVGKREKGRRPEAHEDSKSFGVRVFKRFRRFRRFQGTPDSNRGENRSKPPGKTNVAQ